MWPQIQYSVVVFTGYMCVHTNVYYTHTCMYMYVLKWRACEL
jgi:hypothetical protein